MPCLMVNHLRDFVSMSVYAKVLQYSYACMLLRPACCLTAIFISVVKSRVISMIRWNLWSKTTMMRLRDYSSFFFFFQKHSLHICVNEPTTPLFKTTFFQKLASYLCVNEPTTPLFKTTFFQKLPSYLCVNEPTTPLFKTTFFQKLPSYLYVNEPTTPLFQTTFFQKLPSYLCVNEPTTPLFKTTFLETPFISV